MQTAIQEMIEYIQINATKFSMMNTYNMLKVIDSYLEKEKEQIENAFDLGRDEVTSVFIIDGEDYYNKSFNKS
jgi:hypothetical protein